MFWAQARAKLVDASGVNCARTRARHARTSRAHVACAASVREGTFLRRQFNGAWESGNNSNGNDTTTPTTTTTTTTTNNNNNNHHHHNNNNNNNIVIINNNNNNDNNNNIVIIVIVIITIIVLGFSGPRSGVGEQHPRQDRRATARVEGAICLQTLMGHIFVETLMSDLFAYKERCIGTARAFSDAVWNSRPSLGNVASLVSPCRGAPCQ